MTATRPWLDTSKDIEQRIDLLLAEMTFDEKVGQMHQVHGLKEHTLDALRDGRVGSIFNASGADAGNVRDEGVSARYCNMLQRIAVEESRLGIPVIFARDVIHGHRTVFPIPLGQAATWNPALISRAAAITAREAAADGLHWTFTPMVDVSRDPRWGRIAESFGEDPWLASRLAEAAVRGYQGDDLSAPDRIAACVKHFAGYAGAEGGRDYWEVHCGEREMRDVYLPPFLAAVRAGAATIMSAFHVNDGIPASADHHLLTAILKDEWGFDGFVVSDYGIVRELHEGHGVCETIRDAAALAANAGLDMDMMSHAFEEHLAALVEEGTVPASRVDDAVRRILRVKFRCGLFERPYADESLASSVMLAPEHVDTARQAARESIVLLKNNGILPLRTGEGHIVVTGPLARARGELFGTWTLDGRAEDVTPVGEAIQAAGGEGCRVHIDNENGFADLTLTISRSADVVVACVGEGPWRSGEGNSIATIDLPAGQLELLQQLHALGKPLVVVVFAGRPLALSWLAEHADAILYAWHPGVAGGHAVADVLFGKVGPGGRLPATMPRTTGQVPIHYAHRPTHRPGTIWEVRGWYKDAPHTPLYPFGYGLDYTTFDYRTLTLSAGSMPVDGSLDVSVEIGNTGSRDGTTVAQLYVRDLKASVSRPVKELKGFEKVSIAAGKTATVHFTLHARDLAFTGPDCRPRVEPGEFRLWVGPHAAEGLEAEFVVEDTGGATTS